MTRLKVLVLCLILAQLSCNTLTKPLSNPSSSDGSPATDAAGSPATAATDEAIPAATATMEPLESTPDYFGKLTLLHDYWPAIAKAANFDPAIPASTVLSYFAYSPDGRYVAAAGCDKVRGNGDFYLDFYSCENTVKGTVAHPFLFILDAHTEEIVATLPVSDQIGSVTTLHFSHDGSLLIFGITTNLGINGGQMTLWNVDAGQVEAVLSQDADEAAFSPDDSLIAIDQHGATEIWDVQAQKSVVELPAAKDYGVPEFSSDGSRLLVDSYPVMAVYDTTTWTKLSSIDIPRSGIYEGLEFPDQTKYGECLEKVENEPVKIYDISTDKLLQTLSGKWGECGVLQSSHDGKVVFRFDVTGRKLVAWTVDDWQKFDESDTVSDKITPADKYVGKLICFASDGRSVLMQTFTRLVLFGTP